MRSKMLCHVLSMEFLKGTGRVESRYFITKYLPCLSPKVATSVGTAELKENLVRCLRRL